MELWITLIFALLLAGAFASGWFARRAAERALQIATAFAVSALVAWLAAGIYRRAVGAEFALDWSPRWGLVRDGVSLWSFRFDSSSWTVGLLGLAAISASLLVSLVEGVVRCHGRESDTRVTARFAPAVALLVASASLLVGLADSLVSAWLSITVLVGVWTMLLLTHLADDEGFGEILARAGLLAASIPLIGLAVVEHVVNGGNLVNGLGPESWLGAGHGWIVLAALLLMGVFPLYSWRPKEAVLRSQLSGLVRLVPTLAGLSLLTRVSGPAAENQTFVALVTILGLLGLVVAAMQAWARVSDLSSLRAIVTLALVSQSVLVSVWVGQPGVIAAARVLIFASLVMYLGRYLPARLEGMRTVLGWLAAAAIAMLPGTAAFATGWMLVDSWIVHGQWLLLVGWFFAVVLLYSAVVHGLIARSREGVATTGQKEGAGSRQRISATSLLAAAGVTMLVLGLLAVPQLPSSQTQWLAAALLLLAPTLGVALGWLVKAVPDPRSVFRASIVPSMPSLGILRGTYNGIRQLFNGLRELAAILEGEGGMLWLILLVVIFFVVRR